MQTQTKKYAYTIWRALRQLELSYILVLLALFVVLGSIGLRSNYQTMTTLRQQVYEADQKNGDVEGALRTLRTHVYGHMNTNLQSGVSGVYPPIQLQYTYERLQAAELAKTEASSGKVYSEAQAYCEKLHPESFSGGPRVPCIRDYVATHGVATKTIPDSLYKFDFISPRWSPDLAGWSIVGATLLSILLVLRLAVPVVRKKLRI
jgi:hypothetical protein